ncbi:MAG: hybrid sensor histidine kinase/response regulator [Pedosphaera sp.]|nr:hybrid sensor histidine kinase/response regulator [Pedosphaera sp.]
MSWFQNLPIKRKLTLVILLTCSVVLLLACGILAAYELFDFRRIMVRDMTALADVLAKNSRAALAFKDEDAAHEMLLALQVEPDVVVAGLYTPNGMRFVDYSRSGVAAPPVALASDGYQFAHGHLEIFRPVILNGKRIGTLHLRAELKGVYQRLRLFGGIAVLVLFGSCAVALVISAPLQRPISQPILDLAETARALGEHKDHAVRVTSRGRNEIGMLTDAFQQMLAGIAERENALRTTNETLRGEIGERKSAEGRVQAQLGRLELLNQITRAIGERQDLPSIFQVVIKNLEDYLRIQFGCVCLYDQAGTLTVASVGVQSGTLASELGMTEHAQIPIGENGLSRCVQGRLVYEPDTQQIQAQFPQRLAQGGLRSLVVAPLLVESQVFGVLVAARREPESFSSGECEFLKQLCEHVALAAHQAQLHDALQQAYDDLRQTQQTVLQQERLRALGQMASGIAHDINNALSPVALYTESLLEREPNLSDRARDYLITIQRAVEDVAATVARLREFYRQRESQLTLTPVAVNRLLQQVIDLTRARWRDMPLQQGMVIQMQTELAPDLPAIMGAESEIREALTNLVFNAVDAMPNGGTLTLRTKITEGAPDSLKTAAPHRVQVEVSDTGIGMDEETRRRCLEPFFTTKGERGTGLGLAMVYGMAQRHSAEIEIESIVGRGTTVRLSFVVPATVTLGPTQVAISYPVPSRLRLLIVDDDPMLIKSLRDTLEADGHVVSTANNGQEGIAAFRAAQEKNEIFAVVITDLGMPYMDGRKVASAIKAMSPVTPVILLTGWGQRLLAEGDVPPHVDRVLSKPPKLRELREALAQCLLPKSS